MEERGKAGDGGRGGREGEGREEKSVMEELSGVSLPLPSRVCLQIILLFFYCKYCLIVSGIFQSSLCHFFALCSPV